MDIISVVAFKDDNEGEGFSDSGSGATTSLLSEFIDTFLRTG
jgi:hypothetical protein